MVRAPTSKIFSPLSLLQTSQGVLKFISHGILRWEVQLTVVMFLKWRSYEVPNWNCVDISPSPLQKGNHCYRRCWQMGGFHTATGGVATENEDNTSPNLISVTSKKRSRLSAKSKKQVKDTRWLSVVSRWIKIVDWTTPQIGNTNGQDVWVLASHHRAKEQCMYQAAATKSSWCQWRNRCTK